jgi:hypothetical protein
LRAAIHVVPAILGQVWLGGVFAAAFLLDRPEVHKVLWRDSVVIDWAAGDHSVAAIQRAVDRRSGPVERRLL